MIERLKQRFSDIKVDKYLHFIAGLLIAEVVACVLAHWVGLYALLIGFVASFVAGCLKEVWDEKNGGVVSKYDIIATIIGGAVGTAVILVVLL